MLLSVPYLYAAAVCTTIINDGGPRWFCLLVLLFVWNAFKFLWIGPASLIQLIRVRRNELGSRPLAFLGAGRASRGSTSTGDN